MDRLLKDAMTTRRPTPLGQCPDAEVLAAWADGTIYGAEADGLEAHLADCQRCQAILATMSAADPDADAVIPNVVDEDTAPVTGSATPVIPFPHRPSPMRWAVPLIVGSAAASLLLYMAWPKPSAIPDDVRTSIARAERNKADKIPPVAQSSVTPNAPAETPSIGPAPKVREAANQQAPNQKTTSRAAGTATAAAPPVLPEPLRPTVVAPGQIASPSPTVVLTPTPAATSAAGTSASASDLARVAPLPISRNANAGLVQTRAPGERPELNVLMEFGPADPIANVTLTPTRQGAAPSSPLKNIRWRVMLSGIVEKTIDGGATWSRILIDPAVAITTGASPSNVVCWLAGKAGAVMRSTDGGNTWTRVTAPAATDLVSITASDAQNATVATADGRRLTTTDGGQTWH